MVFYRAIIPLGYGGVLRTDIVRNDVRFEKILHISHHPHSAEQTYHTHRSGERDALRYYRSLR
ncbi:MAG: hypothetical protein FWG20_04850 [Candidatus Cloacimonetes bacterium]|nr:hypothetical protein [Candidatus Cloacimonadota bacterium]